MSTIPTMHVHSTRTYHNNYWWITAVHKKHNAPTYAHVIWLSIQWGLAQNYGMRKITFVILSFLVCFLCPVSCVSVGCTEQHTCSGELFCNTFAILSNTSIFPGETSENRSRCNAIDSKLILCSYIGYSFFIWGLFRIVHISKCVFFYTFFFHRLLFFHKGCNKWSKVTVKTVTKDYFK